MLKKLIFILLILIIFLNGCIKEKIDCNENFDEEKCVCLEKTPKLYDGKYCFQGIEKIGLSCGKFYNWTEEELDEFLKAGWDAGVSSDFEITMPKFEKELIQNPICIKAREKNECELNNRDYICKDWEKCESSAWGRTYESGGNVYSTRYGDCLYYQRIVEPRFDYYKNPKIYYDLGKVCLKGVCNECIKRDIKEEFGVYREDCI